MPGALDKSLLSGDRNAPHRRGRQVAIAATVAGGLLLASMVAYSVGKRSAMSDTQGQVEMWGLTSKRDPWCYGFTGGTCTELACNAERGAICNVGKCECASGCVGADGNCYHGMSNYTRIATMVKLDSVLFPGHLMHMQAAGVWNYWDQIKTSDAETWTWEGQEYFDIYELPGRGDSGEKRYFLASNKWKQYVAAIIGGSALKGRAHAFGLYDKSLGWNQMPWMPYKVTVSLCHVPGKPDVIKIGRPVLNGDHWEWAEVHQLSSFVDTWETPGKGGNWKVTNDMDQPVKVNVEECVLPS